VKDDEKLALRRRALDVTRDEVMEAVAKYMTT
jgi:hypothetical protein